MEGSYAATEDYVSAASNNGRILRWGQILREMAVVLRLRRWLSGAELMDGATCVVCGVWCRTDQSIIHEWFMERQLQDDLRQII